MRASTSFVAAAAFTVCTGILAARPATGQSLAQAETWTATPFVHAAIGVGVPDAADVLADLDNSLGLGVAIGYDLTPNLGFEGEIAHTFDVIGDTDEIDWSLTSFSVNGVYHFDVQNVTPYATLGIGFIRSSFGVDDALDAELDVSSTEVAFNFGGGVKYPIDDRWVIRGDLRRFQANDVAPDFWRLYGGVTFTIGR